MSSIQTSLQNLKTIKKLTNQIPITTHRKITDVIISSDTTTDTTTTILSTITPATIKSILSNPNIKTQKCLSLFHVITKNPSLIPFNLQIDHHVTLICRAIKSKKFNDAENLLCNLRYPFQDFVNFTENECFNSRVLKKLFNLLLKVCSDNCEFDSGFEVFEYMRRNRIEIDERTCTVYLLSLVRCEHLGLGLVFFYRMVEAGIDVSVYSLTVLVDGLCKIGEIRRGRELVEEAVGMRVKVKPNVITFNTLIDSCCKRWDFDELETVLVLMEKEGVERNLESYKFLIDGFLSSGRIDEAERLIMEMYDKDLDVEIHLWNSIMVRYCKLKKMESAFQVFDSMIERSFVPNAETFRIMVSGICGIGEMEAAQELAEKLQRKDIDLGYDVFDDLVTGCCKKGKFDDAVELLSSMEKKGLFGDMRLYNMVIVGLCEMDRVEEATRLLSVVVKCGANVEFFINLIKDPKETTHYKHFYNI